MKRSSSVKALNALTEFSSNEDLNTSDFSNSGEESSAWSFPSISAATAKTEVELVREESIAVKRTKIAAIFVILMAGLGGTLITYYIVKQSEQQDFSDEVRERYLGL
jgi:hypothetical protein